MTGIADGIPFGSARMRLVEAWTAPRTDPAGLGAVVGAVGAWCTFAAFGVMATDAMVHGAPAWTASATMAPAFLMPDVRPGFAHLEQGQMRFAQRQIPCTSKACIDFI